MAAMAAIRSVPAGGACPPLPGGRQGRDRRGLDRQSGDQTQLLQ